MITKENAIQILDNYFDLQYNVEPSNKTTVRAHRILVDEKEIFWILGASTEEDMYNKDGSYGGLGGGVYFIDKENEEIYEIGSAPTINWEEEFNKFKRGEDSEIKWIPRTITYTNCITVKQPEVIYQYDKISCKYFEKEKAVQEYLLNNKSLVDSELNPTIIDKPFELEVGEIMIGINGKIQEKELDIIQQSISGGLENFRAALWDIKKWLRINNKKSSDNYWIEIYERDFEKDSKTWDLKLNMEYK